VARVATPEDFMIKYALRCAENHGFESWFKSGAAFEKLHGAAMVNCPVCGSTEVKKAIMAPRVRPARGAAAPTPLSAQPVKMHALTAPASPAEAAMLELKNKIQKHSEYVGSDFASEARAIHDGDAPERSIYGEANGEEAKQLLEDGVPVAPLPFMPTRKTN
jgi:hypothetical protein